MTEAKPPRIRPPKVHFPNELNPDHAACSIHIRAPLDSDPEKVTCRTCRRWLLPPDFPPTRPRCAGKP